MHQMAIKYTNIFNSKALLNLPKFRFFGLKKNYLAALQQTMLNHRGENRRRHRRHHFSLSRYVRFFEPPATPVRARALFVKLCSWEQSDRMLS
jgi:hypothetical protein